MSDLDELIREADPARHLVVPEPDPSRTPRLSAVAERRHRRTVDAIAAASAVAVALGVSLVVLLAGSHGRRESTPVGSSRLTTVADQPLLRILGVLRRPATAADRAAASRIRGRKVDEHLIRLAAIAPWGEHVVFVPERAGSSGKLSLMLITTSAVPGRSITSFTGALSAASIEQGNAWTGGGAFAPRGGARLVMVVPDGVASVTFERMHGRPLTVSVHDNLALAQLTDYCCASRPVTRWYGSDGQLLRVTGAHPPAIQAPPGAVTVERLREPDGTPFALTLQRVRFKGGDYLCLASIHRGASGLRASQHCAGPLPLPARPLVAVAGGPTACRPHPAQLFWGLALTSVTVSLRSGGRDRAAARRSIPGQLRVPGTLFYVWAPPGRASLLARAAGGKARETLPLAPWACTTPARGAQLQSSSGP